jgi:hypothetical protein
VLPIPDSGQQIQWGSNAQQLGRGANKIVLDGGTGNVTIPGDFRRKDRARASGSFGTVRCVPNTTFGESSIGFYRNGDHSVSTTVAGDFWAVGHHAYGPGDRHFGIGSRHESVSKHHHRRREHPYSLTVGRRRAADPLDLRPRAGQRRRGEQPRAARGDVQQGVHATGEYNIFWQAFTHPDWYELHRPRNAMR